LSEEHVRVACPACGKRFSLSSEAVPEGEHGKSSRCGGCGTPFRVLRRGDDVLAEATPAQPAPAKAAPLPQKKAARKTTPKTTPKTGAPVSAPRRKRTPRKPSSERPPRRPSSGAGLTTTGPIEPPLPPSGNAGTPFGIGDRVGRYEIEGVLARGGMGSLFRAYDPAGNRHVALKVLVSTATDLDKLRFQREIQIQGNVQHPHIMPIFDSGMIGTTRYYTMELLKDPIDLIDLTERARSGEATKDPKLRSIGTLEGLVRHVVVPVCEAIHHANVHEGVLHRDLKPGNVLLDRVGLRPFVIDFGVAGLLEKKNARLAHLDRELPVPLSGKGISITGTLVFMPPEQARGKADRRGDVWALGAILHYLVTGEPPLEGAVRPVVSEAERIEGLEMLIEQAEAAERFWEVHEFKQKLEEIRSGRERTVDQLRADVLRGHYRPLPASMPRALDAIIRKAMDLDPAQRYRHALELRDDLLAWLDGRTVTAMVRGSGAARGALYRTKVFLRRQRALLLLLASLVVIAITTVKLWPHERGVDQGALAEQAMQTALDHEHAGRAPDARAAAREALRHDPEREDAFALMARLDAAEQFAERLGRAHALEKDANAAFDADDLAAAGRAQAALAEVLDTGILPVLAMQGDDATKADVARLVEFASGTLALSLAGVPAGAKVALIPLRHAGGAIRWDHATKLTTTGPDEVTRVAPGAWILRVRRGGGEVLVPFVAEAGQTRVEVTCPIDPARVDAASVYVGAGAARGPGTPGPVGALLWDRSEVTAAAYGAFLATLDAEEQRRRVPRHAGTLGALGEPLWDRQGQGFVPPAGSSRRPVESISLYDAKAYAVYARKRLPTAAEWSWAATGPDGRLCAVGTLRDLLAGGVHMDRPLAGVTDVRSVPADRSPFGVYDMAGNVAEYTSTLGTLRGENGWFVMGSSYLGTGADALVTGARVVPGWMPLEGVGMRCVRDVK